MNELERIGATILSDQITLGFSLLIAGWAVFAIMMTLLPTTRHKGFTGRLVSITPNSLATLGVLGTFTGILLGLLDFDVTRIDESVPQLLSGLKIAFTTSIVGIAASISFRLVRAFMPEDVSTEGVRPEDIHTALVDIRDDARSQGAAASAEMKRLRAAIASDEDGSLYTQMVKLRTESRDGHNALIKEFQEFAEHMVENNQKAIVEALEEVIRDFNNNLTEQFGENFKQLNAAVESLVTWQDRYRVHVETLEGRFEAALKGIERSDASLDLIRENAESIPEVIEPLAPVLRAVHEEVERLNAQFEGFAELRDKATEAFPVIEKNLDKITTGFGESVNEALELSRRTLLDGKLAHESLIEDHDRFLSGAKDAQKTFDTALEATLSEMQRKSAESFSRHSDLIAQAAEASNRAINEAWAKSAETMDSQFATFDDQMQKELSRSLQVMGQNLGSVSEKFVSDYSAITHQLRKLVNSSGAGARVD